MRESRYSRMLPLLCRPRGLVVGSALFSRMRLDSFQLQNFIFQFLKYLSSRQSVPVISVSAPLDTCGLDVLRFLPELSFLKALSYLPICLVFV